MIFYNSHCNFFPVILDFNCSTEYFIGTGYRIAKRKSCEKNLAHPELSAFQSVCGQNQGFLKPATEIITGSLKLSFLIRFFIG